MEHHLATVWEQIADEQPDAIALRHGDQATTWRDFDQRAARFATAMLAAGVRPGDTVAVDLFNCSEYLEVFHAALKIRAVPANINHRYLDEELRTLLDQLDTRVLVYSAPLRDRIAGAVATGNGFQLVVEVGFGNEPEIDGRDTTVRGYEALIAAHSPAERIERPPHDTFLSCTGGTTGLPKAVEYVIARNIVNLRVLGAQMLALDADWAADPLDRARDLRERGLSPVTLPASPLMHSTGLIMASLPTLTCGGNVVTLTSRSLDADELWSTVERTRPRLVSIVGDAFARPMLRALDRRAAAGAPYDTRSLAVVSSAGVAWSGPVKQALLDHVPQVALVDACGSSEGATIGSTVVRRGDTPSTDHFDPAPGLRLLHPDGSDVPRDSSEEGMFLVPTVARGYRKDPERTAAAFREVDGRNYVLTGDWGRWNPDGTITLIGRGTSTINTGGEKVFPEEVEKVVCDLPNVDDCVVVGRADDRFGSTVAAVVQLGSLEDPETAAVRITAAVRARLAGYKVPRTLVFDRVPRAANGKMLHAEARRLLERRLAEEAQDPTEVVDSGR